MLYQMEQTHSCTSLDSSQNPQVALSASHELNKSDEGNNRTEECRFLPSQRSKAGGSQNRYKQSSSVQKSQERTSVANLAANVASSGSLTTAATTKGSGFGAA